MAYHRSSISQINFAGGFPRTGASLMLLLLGLSAILIVARSIPEFVQRLGGDCTGCELVAFEPPLKPYGQKPATPINPASTGEARLTLWFAPETPSLAGRVRVPGEDVTRDPAKIDPWWAATFNAPNRIGDTDANPETAALPAWASSESGLALAFAKESDAPRPGVAVARMAWFWHDRRAEGGRDPDGRDPDGRDPNGRDPDRPAWAGLAPGSRLDGFAVGGRVAVEKALERHFTQVGMGVLPGARHIASASERPADAEIALSLPASGNLNFSEDGPKWNVTGANPPARSSMNGGLSLGVFHAEASYDLTPAITPSIQYFRAADPVGSLRYAWPGSRGQTSAGVAAGVTYSPWNDPASPLEFLNLRIAARYVAYTEFAGIPRGAAPANALSLRLWGALRF
jgi:hypothetical protein